MNDDRVERILQRAAERGWSPDLVQRAVDLRVPVADIENWLRWIDDEESVKRRLDWHERLTFGDLRGREARGNDNEAFADLMASSAEDLGEWEITTERGPNAFAPYRLQENVTILLIEKEGLLIASCSFSGRKTIVGGKKMVVRYGQALRVRPEFRRQGYGDAVRNQSWGAGVTRPTQVQYDIMRSQNYAVVGWWKKYHPEVYDGVPEREGDIPGESVTVLQYTRRAFDGDASGIRKVAPADIPRCVEIINATHDGQDLFRPYTDAFLSDRLDDGWWGDPPDEKFWPHVYGWDDHYVIEEDGRVVACAGLWDRGRDMRDRWRHKETGDERVVAAAAMMDFGFEPGREDAMARLIAYLIGETDKLGRDYLLAPLEHLPAVAEHLSDYESSPETRAFRWGAPEPKITRVYLDMAYW